jgi:hypothetical protein
MGFSLTLSGRTFTADGLFLWVDSFMDSSLLRGGRSSSNWQVSVTSHTGIERENRRSFQRTAMPSRSCVELKGRPVKRFAERSAGVKQGELGIAKSCVGSLSFFQLPVKFVHELGS